MNHKQKVYVARLIRQGTQEFAGLFQSRQWISRRAGIAARVNRKQAATHEKALIRKGEYKPSVTRRAMKYLSSISRLQRAKAARRAKFEARNATK